jgi:beta-glucanase (GH16 family)
MSLLGQGSASASTSPPSSWKLKFNQSFAGKKLNTNVWATCYPGATPKGCTNYSAINGEQEWYQPSQVTVSDDALHLTARRVATAGYNAQGQPKTYECRSGMVATDHSFAFDYGYVQIKARIPYGTGLWPAIWLGAENNQWPPEIDILEHWASDNNFGAYLHWGSPASPERIGIRQPLWTNLSKGWHTFTLYWTKSRITWYIDGRQVLTTTEHIPNQKMYLIMDVADTSLAKGACTGTMLVESVKIWQPST